MLSPPNDLTLKLEVRAIASGNCQDFAVQLPSPPPPPLPLPPIPFPLQVPIEVYAQYCHKRVEKMTQTGAKKGVKKPSIEEVMHAKVQRRAQYHQYNKPFVFTIALYVELLC